MLSLEAEGRRRKGFDRALQKRVNGFPAFGQIDRSVRRGAALADAVEQAHAGHARARAAASAPARPRARDRCRHCTTCAHWRRHSTKRGWRRASSSKLCANSVRPRRESTQRAERVDHRALVERPVGEVRIDEDRSRARRCSRGRARSAARTASRNSAREAIGTMVVGGHVVLLVVKRSAVGTHQPARSHSASSARAAALALGDALRVEPAPRRRAGASASHRARRRGTPRR